MLMYIRTICLGILFFSNIILLTSSASKENESYIRTYIFIGVRDVCLYYKNNKSFSSLIFSLFDTTKVHNTKSFARKYDYYSSNEDVWVYSVKKCFFNDPLEYVLSLIKIHWIIWQLFSNELIDTRIRFKSLFNKLKNFSNDPYSNNLICYTIYRTIQFFLHA